MVFDNANKAFIYLYKKISNEGINIQDTKAALNVGFYLKDPMENNITEKFRNWSRKYAQYEWQWYLTANPNAEEIAKKAKIWYSCMDASGNVNSNYGYHWMKNNQLDYVVDELKNNPDSRRASISIYNAKERYNFENDTPCTYAINFSILNDRLNMSVLMRSNDLWFGFCNDQYCFSKLQEEMSKRLELKIGYYYHFSQNLHIYNNFLNRNNE
jgi:thymidylate synthase|tara:strand:- start:170 stop:808 length:639 start_codon:yes stop_codon:yes gene_type:complete